MMYKTNYDSPVGQLLLTSDGESLTGLWIKNQKSNKTAPSGQQLARENRSLCRRCHSLCQAKEKLLKK